MIRPLPPSPVDILASTTTNIWVIAEMPTYMAHGTVLPLAVPTADPSALLRRKTLEHSIPQRQAEVIEESGNTLLWIPSLFQSFLEFVPPLEPPKYLPTGELFLRHPELEKVIRRIFPHYARCTKYDVWVGRALHPVLGGVSWVLYSLRSIVQWPVRGLK